MDSRHSMLMIETDKAMINIKIHFKCKVLIWFKEIMEHQ